MRAARAVREWVRQWRWPLTGLLMLAAAVLGFIGLGEVGSPGDPAKGVPPVLPPPLVDRVYDTIILFRMSSPFAAPYPWPLEVARWLAPATLLYAALRAVGAVFAQQWSELRVRAWARGHVIVCGLGDCGLRLALAFRAEGARVVVVDKEVLDAAGPAGVQQCRAHGISVLPGDATDPYVLARAAVRRARYLVAVCGDDETNADVVLAARRAFPAASTGPGGSADGPGGSASVHGGQPPRRRPTGGHVLRGFVQVGDDRLCRLLEEAVLADPTRAEVRLEFFNVVRSGLKALLDQHGGLLLSPGLPPHLVVVGTGRVARQLVSEAARRWWLMHARGTPPCHITLVAPDAPTAVAFLQERFPALGAACDLAALAADPSDPESPGVAVQLAAPHDRCLAIVCSDGDDAAVVRAAIVTRRSLPEAVPIVVCTRGRSAVPGLLGGAGSAGFPNVVAFGLLDRVCTPEVLVNGVQEELAQSVHADYVRRRREELAISHSLYLTGRQADDGLVPIGDQALQPWERLPEALKDSNRDQAADIGRKLALIGCHLEPTPAWDTGPRPFTEAEVELLARAEHERWSEERTRGGWQWGEARDVEKKLSPDLVPWDTLGERSRDLDRDAVRAIPLFLARLGYAVVRTSGAAPGPPPADRDAETALAPG